jgi:hypothetical protein
MKTTQMLRGAAYACDIQWVFSFGLIDLLNFKIEWYNTD